MTTPEQALLRIENVSRTFRSLGGLLGGRRYNVAAVQDVTLHVETGEIFGLVGESGSGKSTLARMIVGLERPDRGRILIGDHTMNGACGDELRQLRRTVQMVFQNPYAALDPLQRVDDAIVEPLRNMRTVTKSEGERVARNALRDVGLPERLLRAYPYQLSGGERQRVCIARALSVNPRLLVCDEAVSALDKTVQAQVLQLLRALQQRHGLTILFISHDLAAVNTLCDRVAVMCKGRIVETGACAQVLRNPADAYTQALLSASRYLESGNIGGA